MNFFIIGFLIMQAARLACGTCVLESEFGFILNCNFKQSGLFRVRNLGGVKAHFGLGFSLGDELGFGESLGNLEGGRRRALSYRNGQRDLVGVLPATQQVQPAQHPIPDKRIMSRSPQAPFLPVSAPKVKQIPIKQQAPPVPLMTEARPLPLGVPAFRPIPKTATMQVAQRRTNIAVDTPNPRVSLNNKVIESYSQPVHSNRTFHVVNPTVSQPVPAAVPAFQAMPKSVAPITAVLDKETHIESRVVNRPVNRIPIAEEPKFDLKDVTVEELAAAANVSVETIKHAIYVREQQMKAEHRAMLAAKLREEFIRTSTTAATITTTTTTAAPRPMKNINDNIAHENKVSKVMNAPREYYPVNYDKNFDDNFKSKVDLPPTSFVCGKQKHFPGLYADMDLGCMVFHVCALTDDGLVRKSFLCPENTLFDQTILKCNWWFYVDCSASKSVYDSNIPISKSYQLMKSLTYFSKYAKNHEGENTGNGLDIQVLKNTMDEAARSFNADSDKDVDDDTDVVQKIAEHVKKSEVQTSSKNETVQTAEMEKEKEEEKEEDKS